MSKQETLEEAAKRYDYTLGVEYCAFIEGAKWHQEQDKNKFSEEYMIEFGKFCHSDAYSINRVKTFKELFEHFKNK